MTEKLLLTKDELLVGTGLSLIGIVLPQEYQLRVHKLFQLAKEKGLENITVDDSVRIKFDAAEEIARRTISKED